MSSKQDFAPFSPTAPLFAPQSHNPFLQVREYAEPVAAVDAVWCQDSGEDGESDAPAPEAVDVRIMWGANVLHFVQLSPPRPFTLGGADCDFTLPEGATASTVEGRYPLVCLSAGAQRERPSVFVGDGVAVELRLQNGSVLSLPQCTANGLTEPSTVAGAVNLVLPHGATATVRLPGSGLTLEVARGRARSQPESGLLAGADLSGQIYTGLSALAHATVVGALAFFLPAMQGDDAEAIDRNSAEAMRPYLDAIAERTPERQDVVSEAGPSAPSGGGAGSAADAPSGKLGVTVTRSPSSGRFGVQGDTQDTRLARSHELEMAATFGILNILSGDASSSPTSTWGAELAAGHDAKSASGGMWGQSIDDALGSGGLGLSGTEVGGGGLGKGIGLDGIGSTIGHGSGDVGGDGPGRGPGHEFGPGGSGHAGPLGGHVPTGPRLRENPITTFSGSLPREVVQRVVRQNFGRFRLCYEAGLRGNPGLTGRVAVAFVIDRNGGVAMASADRSTEMADSNVVACVVRGFQNLSFPAPKDGLVQVVYPLMLAPGE